jgi:hypothetical protein
MGTRVAQLGTHTCSCARSWYTNADVCTCRPTLRAGGGGDGAAGSAASCAIGQQRLQLVGGGLMHVDILAAGCTPGWNALRGTLQPHHHTVCTGLGLTRNNTVAAHHVLCMPVQQGRKLRFIGLQVIRNNHSSTLREANIQHANANAVGMLTRSARHVPASRAWCR